jgi:hypothetical protein
MAMKVGSWIWCEKTKGKLRWSDRFSLLSSATVSLTKLSPNLLRARLLGWHRRQSPTDLSRYYAPTTGAARSAFESCKNLSPAFMLNHCERTYWFSRLLGIRWALEFDDEFLYVAAMLHDIALMEGFEGRRTDDHCFTIPSARLARALGEEAGWTDEKKKRLMEAITLNPNPSVRREEGVEAHLLNAGVLIDATGMRLWELHPDEIQTILRMAPRAQFKSKIVSYINREANDHPGCRFHFERRWFQFHRLAAMAPFAE